LTPTRDGPIGTESRRMKAKVCMVGEAGTGKTDLIRNFVHQLFDDTYIQTLGTKVSRRELSSTSPDGLHDLKIDLIIWDIMGEKGFRELLKQAYFYGSGGILAVCDISRKKTLDDLDGWIEGVQSVAGKIPIVLAINRRDQSAPEEITESDAKRFAAAHEASYFYTSDSGENVDAVFDSLGMRVAENRLGHGRDSPK
jgi:small GTP-binding protein